MVKIDALLKLLETLPASLLAGPPAPVNCRPYKELTLRGFDVRLEIGGRTYELSTTDAPDGDGFRSRGLAFARRVVPLATGMLLEQQIVLPNAGDAVGISWRLLGNNITPVRLTATPIFSSAEPISSEIFVFDAEHDGGRLTWSPFCRAGRIIADMNGNSTEPAVMIDSDGQKNTAAPSAFVFDLGLRPALLLLSVELWPSGATDPLVGAFLADVANPRRENRRLLAAVQRRVMALQQAKANSSRVRRPDWRRVSWGNYLQRASSPAAMNLFCIGLSYHRSRVEELEQFAGHSETLDSLGQAGCAEALLLSTCNRVEVYAAAEAPVPIPQVARCLARDFEPTAEITPDFYCYEATDCVQHLFRVAAGVDSMVVGETEILGQVKKAYESARASATAGPYLHRLLQRAFRVAKQVRTLTHITRGSVSIGSVAVALASKVFGDLAEREILILGAGETGERTVRALISRGACNVRVSNRSPARAMELAELVGGVAVPFNQWLQHCAEVDIVVTATASDAPLLNPGNLAPILRERVDRPLFIIDIAVPRDVHPEVNQLKGVFLYDIDSLRSVAEQSLVLRRQQIASAEAIISAHVSEFWARLSSGASREKSCPGALERSATSGAGTLGLWSAAGRFVAGSC